MLQGYGQGYPLADETDVLKAQLAHSRKGDLQKARDRMTFNDERRKLTQAWADHLDGLRTCASVVPVKRKVV